MALAAALGGLAIIAAGIPLLAGAPYTVAAGTTLYVRLDTEVSTKTSHLQQAVSAHVVREVSTDQGVWIPMGAVVTGKIEKLIPSSDPTDHARMLLRFTNLVIPGRTTLSLTAHLIAVDNARETVLADGTIQGVLEKDAAVGRMDTLLDRMGTAGGKLESVSDRTVGKPDTSIDYPVGTDLELTLDQPLSIETTSPAAAAPQISPALAEAVQRLLADAPQRVESKGKKPGDPLNLIIVGGSDEVQAAFQKAGWITARKLGAHTAIDTVRAMASEEGYDGAPVSQLYLYGRVEDWAFEKMLNTFLKRHHLRLWKTPVATADDRAIWLGASTHDIGIDRHRAVVSHEIDTNLDAERSKVGADLMASGLVAAEQLVTPPQPLTGGKTATGDAWTTDGRLLVIELKPAGTL